MISNATAQEADSRDEDRPDTDLLSASRLMQIIDRPGPEEFSATLDVQYNLLEAKQSDRAMADVLILVEHAPVFTVGRSVAFQKPSQPNLASIPWVEIGRGGKATWHGPGQLTVYPIFDLLRHGKDVHVYLRKLEQLNLAVLARFGLEGFRKSGQTGVWIRKNGMDKKITSIGVGVRKWISHHGFALNVNCGLDGFRGIQACDSSGSVMTSMRKLLGADCPSIEQVKAAVLEECLSEFDLKLESAEKELSEKDQQGLRQLSRRSRPSWLKAKAPGSPGYLKTQEIVKGLGLTTVCEEARCPNIGECWQNASATMMIMGELCTRRCSFCSVQDGTLDELKPLDPLEPVRCAQAVKRLSLEHIVITSVNRDDLPDMGALHFDRVVRAIAKLNPDTDIELLIPDMRGKRELVETILQSGSVFGA